MLSRIVFVLCLATGFAAAGVTSAASAAPGQDYFVVNTQFWGAPSPITDAGGTFAGCTSVKDLGGTATQTGPQELLFEGQKRVTCPSGKVTIGYEATINAASGKRTRGTWWIISSTLSGATSGGGTVVGDNTVCETLRNSGGCILDTFTGTTS